MMKKMLLTGGLVLVAPGSSAQIMMGILIALAYLLIFVKASPYEEDNDDVLEFVCTLAILLTLLGGFALKTQPEPGSPEAADGDLYEEGLMSGLLILSNVVVFALGFLASVMSCPCFGDVQERCMGEADMGLSEEISEFVSQAKEKIDGLIHGGDVFAIEQQITL